MSYLLLIFLGFLPSLVWLVFYLRKDVHPEPNWMIIKIFIFGMAAAPLAALIQLGLLSLLEKHQHFLLSSFPLILLGVAFIEEYAKYFVVKIKVLKSPEFDEPVDAMIYCIIAALGFAAIENIFVLVDASTRELFLGAVIGIVLLRFAGATFLHALSSAIIGYFLASALLKPIKGFPPFPSFLKKIRFLRRRGTGWERKKLILKGIALATFLHALYNYFIKYAASGNASLGIYSLVALLSIMALMVSIGFVKLKKAYGC